VAAGGRVPGLSAFSDQVRVFQRELATLPVEDQLITRAHIVEDAGVGELVCRTRA
jgi:hypothetical protein